MDSANADNLVLIRKLQSIFDLNKKEEAAVAQLPLQAREFRKDHDVVREGDRPSQCCVMLEGLACRYKLVAGGKRQIFSFQLPGDIPDLYGLQIDVMDHNIGTLAKSRIGFIPYAAIIALTEAHPRVAKALWRDLVIEASIAREWIVGMGQRQAYCRIAHFLCEMLTRLAAIGRAANFIGELPISQETIDDALGISTVHVNRCVQAMRRDKLVEFKNGTFKALDWERLKQVAEFDAGYLHLRAAPLP